MFENPKVFVSQPMKGKTKEKILEEGERVNYVYALVVPLKENEL